MAGWDLTTLRERLKREREARGVTLEDVAAHAVNPETGGPVGRATVWKWESGKNALPIYALSAYESALGIPIEIIVGGEVPLPITLSGDRAALAREVLEALPRLDDARVTALRVILGETVRRS